MSAPLADIEAASRAVRFQRAGIKIDGIPFDLRKYPYLIEMFDTIGTVPKFTVRKGAQLGLTATMVICTIDLGMYKYPRGILYLMPTRDDVHDFSRSRFDRLLKDNWNVLGSKVRGTDSMSIKRIGNAFVYFRGAKSRSQLKSIPCDCVIMDERDEMDGAQVELARHRLDGSDFQHEIDFSTPTLPEYGVDASYAESDQRMWHIKCKGCNAWTCLELEFPKCLDRKTDGSVVRICVKCGKKLEIADGQHVAAYPERSEEHVGYYISQLCSPRVAPSKMLSEWEEAESSGGLKLREFKNSRLGIGHADTEDVMTEALLRDILTPDAMRLAAAGPCAMGVDIGKSIHHYWIAQRSAERLVEVVSYGRTDWEGLHDLHQKFNVYVTVLDEMAETSSVKAWKEKHGGAYGCWYSESQRADYSWDEVERRVTVNRTELLDYSHREVLHKRVRLPRPGEEFPQVIKQMGNLARKTLHDEETGTPTVRWVVRGRKNDHYRHAFAYLMLALKRTPIAQRARPRSMGFELGPAGGSWMSS